MTQKLIALSILFALTACGGDGSGSSPSPAPTPPAPSPAPTPPAPSPSTCTNSPVVTASTTYVGVIPQGVVGSWNFDTAAGTESYSVGSYTVSSAAMTRDSSTCSYTTSVTGALRTSFLSNGLAVSAASFNGHQVPALLIANPTMDVSQIAGTYNVLRYTTEITTSTAVTSDYATFNVDSSGNWSSCPNAAYSTSCGGPSGTLTSMGNGTFGLVMNGAGVGQLVAKVVNGSKVLAVAINTGPQSDLVSGMWVGASNDAFVSGADDGTYIANSTDPSTDTLTFAGLTGSVGTNSATLNPNTPVQGLFTIGTTGNIALLSGAGIYAAMTPATGSSAYIQIGVKEGN